MPVTFPPSGCGYTFQTTTKAGVTVTTGGAAHTMGAWTTILSALSFDAHALLLNISGVSAGDTDTRFLLDIGISGGAGTEQVIIPYLNVGAAAASAAVGKTYLFPVFIPAGKSVVARGQALAASDTSVIVAHAIGLPFYGFSDLIAETQEWTAYGIDAANSQGTALTSGNGAYGTAALVGTTSRDHRLWHVGIDWRNNTTISQGRYRVRLSRDSAGSDIIGVWEFTAPTANEDITGPVPDIPVYRPLPAGTTLYVACDGADAEAMSACVYAA